MSGKTHFKVNCLIAGAQKAGTTSLFYYLRQHPDCVSSPQKEPNFFNNARYEKLGFDWYHKQFSVENHHKVVFEASDYMISQQALDRINDYNPSMYLVVLLRNPVERAYSAWNMFRQLHALPIRQKDEIHSLMVGFNEADMEAMRSLICAENYPTFSEAINKEIEELAKSNEYSEPSFVKAGLYADQIENILSRFPKEQLFIIDSDTFMDFRIRVMQKLTRFLKIPDHNWHSAKMANFHSREYDVHLDEGDKSVLEAFYEPHNQRLFNILGRYFDW